ncbi:hypothetical protein [Paenibacillus sp. UNC451MF]|uniref:hypothetical protein n=1 Tax=Paenibacillus sp. UNC451MF TaxID=1449063 RepID=UPI00048E33BE|nr:hypothetical protein [Paenibacillus sp. UNC451MF]
MTVTIGCYHAHYSNIEIIQKALEPYDVELLHFVDPGLDRRKSDPLFSLEKAQRKIKETLDWVAASRVDAILVTCTFFTAHMPEELDYGIPIIKIDDPLFESICESGQPPLLVFTNPATVQGTLERLIRYAMLKGKQLDLQSQTLEHSFELLMQGKKGAYVELVAAGLKRWIEAQPDRQVWAAQLSMVQAAEEAERASGVRVGDPLKALVGHLVERLQL